MITAKFYNKMPQEAIDIRVAVFMEEQGFENEFDKLDEVSTHLLLFQDDQAMACCRFYKTEEPGTYVLGRLAVKKEARGLHLGEQLVKESETYIRSLYGKKVIVSGQVRVQGFYEKQGYVASGDVYLDEDCPHIHLEKVL